MISEARWQVAGYPACVDTLRSIEASPYVYLSSIQFGFYHFANRHGDIVRLDRGATNDNRCVFCWYVSCLNEEEICDHKACERALRRSNAI